MRSSGRERWSAAYRRLYVLRKFGGLFYDIIGFMMASRHHTKLDFLFVACCLEFGVVVLVVCQ